MVDTSCTLLDHITTSTCFPEPATSSGHLGLLQWERKNEGVGEEGGGRYDGGQIPPIADEKGCAMGDKSPQSWMKRVDRGSSNTISCRSSRYGVERLDIALFNTISCRTNRYRVLRHQCSGPVVQDTTRHHAGASWTLTTTTPTTTDLPPLFPHRSTPEGRL